MTANNLIFPKNYNIIQNKTYNRLTMLLKEQYPDLYEDIVDDGYKIENFDFDYFKEIIYDGETVGFISLKYLDKYRQSVQECYIEREYRGNNLMFDELRKLSSIPTVSLYAKKPNFAFTKMLEKNKAGKYLTDDIFLAGIEMVIDSDDIYINQNIGRYYNSNQKIQNFSSSYIYDIKHKFCYFSDEWNEISQSVLLGIVKPRKSDLEKYEYDFLNNISIRKIYKLSKIAHDCWDDIENSWGIWENLLDDYNDINKIIGTPDELTDEMKTILTENDLDEDFGFKIRNHIITANQDVHLKKKFNLIRRDFLVANPDKINRRSACEIIRDENGNICPVCENYATRYENCSYCGFDFENIDYIYRLLEDIEKPEKHILHWRIKYINGEYPSRDDLLDCYHILSYLKDNPSTFDNVIEAIELNTDDSFNLFNKQNMSTLIEPVDSASLTADLNKSNTENLKNMLSSKKKLLKHVIKNNNIPPNYTGKYKLSKEGVKFLDEMNWIDIYDEYLSKFEFSDFYNSINNNKDVYNQILVLLDKYLDKSFEMLPVDDCYEAKSDIYYHIEDYESCLIQSLKRFILRLNPSHSFQAFYMKNYVFDEHNIWLIKESLSKLDIEIEEFFDEIWNEFRLNNYYSTKDVAITYLNKALDDSDLKELSEEYYDKYLF